MKKILVSYCLIFLLYSCQSATPRKIDRAFYYWKSNYELSGFEKKKLDSLGVQTIYIKYFDVVWDPLKNDILPVAKLQFKDTASLHNKQVVPAVFITNEAIQKTDSTQVRSLARKIVLLVNDIHQKLPAYQELQIDCDWTQSTRDTYFSLLREIRVLINNTTLSATIRMHQVKYKKTTGVPPVQKGLLMCYNMGDLKKAGTKNSILDPAEFEKYTSGLADYPLYLDIALPLFNWCVLFRDRQYRGLVQSIREAQLQSTLFSKNNNWYTFTRDTLLNGISFIKGDMLRKEDSRVADIHAITTTITKKLKNTGTRVSFYHIDPVILSKFSTHDLEALYNSLR